MCYSSGREEQIDDEASSKMDIFALCRFVDLARAAVLGNGGTESAHQHVWRCRIRHLVRVRVIVFEE